MPDLDRLFDRSTAIRERRSNGLAMPILEALSLRRHWAARNELAGLLTDPWLASARDRHRGLTVMRADAFRGDGTALYNLAIEHRNRGDMQRYRYWPRRAATATGDPYVKREVRFFETRFPHDVMQRFRRIRPWRKRDDWQCV